MSHGNGHDDNWDNLGPDVRAYMSNQFRQPGQTSEEIPPPDPREASQFRAVWDKLASDPVTNHIIDYINGITCDPIPTLTEIVAAFYMAGRTHAIVPAQISTIIVICGGQLSRYVNLRADVIAEWDKIHKDYVDGIKEKVDARASTGVPWAQSVPAFIKAQRPPEYLIEPLIQRASLYTVTALTSHGKTAVLLYLALCVASGRSVAGKHTVRGRVVWFAGENPADFAQKLMTACHHWDIDPAELDMVVMAGAFDLASMPDEAVKMAAAGRDTALVVVDTSAAYRFDDDEDSNANAIAWARMLRQHFPAMAGQPAVLVATHPTKHADDTNLIPRGGGAFLNEVDGNLCLWADQEQTATTLHWQGKFRGMTFSPIVFELRACPHPAWTFRNGDPVMVKLAVPADDQAPHRPSPSHATKANGAGRGRRPNDEKASLARKILADLLVTEGKAGFAPAGLPAVPEERWRTEFYSRACLGEDKTDTKLKSFKRAADLLLQAEAVATANKWVWLTHVEVE